MTIDVLDNDTDSDGDTLTVSGVTQPANGTAIINPDNTTTYTPDANFNGNDSFSYTISDGNGGTDTANVTVAVTSVNDTPVAADDNATTPEDTAVTINVLANDSDVDGDTLTVTAVTTPTHGTVVINPDNTITYTPDADFNGADSFSYTVNDGNGGTATAIVTLAVTSENDNPVATDDSAATPEDVAVTINVLANDSDVDGDALTVTTVTTPTHGMAVINPDDTIAYMPDANYNGADSFSYTVNDGNGGTTTATVTISVTSVNDNPVTDDDSSITSEDTAIAINVLSNDSDVDGDALTVTLVTAPANGLAVINPDNTITYTPDTNYNGVDNFNYTVSDGNGGTNTAIVVITVMPINDDPVANDDAAAAAEDTAATIAVLANDSDVDGDTLAVTTVTTPTNGSIVINPDNTITYTPTAGYNGLDSFSYTVSDGNGGSDTAVVTVTITAENDNPVASDDNAVTTEDAAVTIDALANDSDIDGDVLTVTAVTPPTHGVVVINPDNTVAYTPDADFNGGDSFSYTVSDGNGGSDTANVFITVTAVNDSPAAIDDSATTLEDTADTFDVLVNDSDVDGDMLTVTTVTAPANGTAIVNPDNTVTYTPNADFNGSDSFSYTVSDGNGGDNTAIVTITIMAVNDTPAANDDNVTTSEDTVVSIDVLTNDSDVDGNTLMVTAVTTPTNDIVVINPDNTIAYTPTANYNGGDSFNYTISDGSGSNDTAIVIITVTAVNDTPAANDDAATTPEDTAVTIDVLGNDSDVEGDALTVTAVTMPTNGLVVINPDNTITYTPSSDYNGTDSFSYTIDDGNGGTAITTVDITVIPINDLPIANDDSAITLEDMVVSINVLANDSDVDGNTLTVAVVTTPIHGSAAINPDNSVTYTPDPNYNGSDSFSYTISDGNGGSDTAIVMLTVTNGNDDPTAVNDNATILEDTAVTINVLANDADIDDDTLSVSSITTPTNGTVAINPDSTVTYTPGANFNGSDSFSYTVDDGNGGNDTAVVMITIAAVNDAPTANDDSEITLEDQQFPQPAYLNRNQNLHQVADTNFLT